MPSSTVACGWDEPGKGCTGDCPSGPKTQSQHAASESTSLINSRGPGHIHFHSAAQPGAVAAGSETAGAANGRDRGGGAGPGVVAGSPQSSTTFHHSKHCSFSSSCFMVYLSFHYHLLILPNSVPRFFIIFHRSGCWVAFCLYLFEFGVAVFYDSWHGRSLGPKASNGQICACSACPVHNLRAGLTVIDKPAMDLTLRLKWMSTNRNHPEADSDTKIK